MSLSAIAALALQVGPAAIRGISSLFGGNSTVDKVADAVEVAHQEFSTTEAKQASVSYVLESFTPEQQLELETLRVRLEQELTERAKIAAQDRQAEHRETQLTIRNGDNADDSYVRRTRPKGCIVTLYWGIAYIFVFELLEAFNHGKGADWEFASFFFAPFMTYLGWRTADKAFEKKHGRPMGLSDSFEGAKLAVTSLANKAVGARA